MKDIPQRRVSKKVNIPWNDILIPFTDWARLSVKVDDGMSRCGPRIQNSWCQGSQWAPCFKARGQVPPFILLDLLAVSDRVDGLVLGLFRSQGPTFFGISSYVKALYMGLLLSSNSPRPQPMDFLQAVLSSCWAHGFKNILGLVPLKFMSVACPLCQTPDSCISLPPWHPHLYTNGISNLTRPSLESWCHTTLSPTCNHAPVLPISGNHTTVYPVAQARNLGLFLSRPTSNCQPVPSAQLQNCFKRNHLCPSLPRLPGPSRLPFMSGGKESLLSDLPASTPPIACSPDSSQNNLSF